MLLYSDSDQLSCLCKVYRTVLYLQRRNRLFEIDMITMLLVIRRYHIYLASDLNGPHEAQNRHTNFGVVVKYGSY